MTQYNPVRYERNDFRAPQTSRILPSASPPIALRLGRIPKLVRYCWALFAFTIPFETVLSGGQLSLSKLSGFGLFLSCLIYRRTIFGRTPRAGWYFFGYLLIYSFFGFWVSEEDSFQYFMRLLTLAQLLTLMWVSWSILRDEQMVLWLLRAYSLGAGLLALLHLLVPGVSTDYTGSGYAGPTGARETALSYNPNDLAGVMTIGAVMAIGVWVVDKRRRFLSPALMVVSTLLPAAVVVRTGSRGGMVAFLAGVAVFLLPIGTSQKRLRLIGFSALVVLAAMVQLATNPVALDRWTNTFEEGEMAGRDTIYATALEMISERPLLGWHPVTFQHELGAREGGLRERDAHNLFLHLLLEVGIVGTIPFLIGMMACLVSAWGARAGPLGLSPLALLVAVLTINMSGTWLAMKQLWIIFGFALASGWSRRRPNPKKQLVTLPAFR